MVLTTALSMVLAASANAAAITNLSPQPQTVGIGVGQAQQDVTIAPNATWRVPGKVVAHYRGGEVHMNDDEEFAIWTDGTFGPQKRQTRGHGNLDF